MIELIKKYLVENRAVRFQNFHLGSGSGLLGVKEPRFGAGFGTFIKRTIQHFKAFAQQIVMIKLQNEQLITS